MTVTALRWTAVRHQILTWIAAGSVRCYSCQVTMLPGPDLPDGWDGTVWYPIHEDRRVSNWLCEQQWRELWLPAKRGWARERPMVLSGPGKRLLAEWNVRHGLREVS